MKNGIKQKIVMVIGFLALAGILVMAGVYLARMRPDDGKPIRWQGHETGYTNVTSAGGVR